MTAHTHTTLIEGCYRCDLNRDEIAVIEKEISRDAQSAWIAYRDEFTQGGRVPRTQLRRRDFIAGYKAALR